MTIQDLEELGFERVDVTEEELLEIGDEDSLPYFYFSKDILPIPEDDDSGEDNYFVLESVTSDDLKREEALGDGWYVEMFDFEEFRFYKKEDVQMIEMLLKDNAYGKL